MHADETVTTRRSGLEDSGSWARKNSTFKGGGAIGWAHPMPKEKRLDEFRALVDGELASRSNYMTSWQGVKEGWGGREGVQH
jgi:hypothetical protein